MGHKFKTSDKVIVRDNNANVDWHFDLFSHYNCKDSIYKYATISGNWEYCLPYEGNEHLIGSIKDPEEKDKPFEWGERLIRKDVVFPDNNECIFICYLSESECKILYKDGLSCFGTVNPKELRRQKDE